MLNKYLNLNNSWIKIVEGSTTLFVPKESINSNSPPYFPAFYNPKGKSNRDISIIIYRSFGSKIKKKIKMADSFAGIGARGIRVGFEAPEVSQIYLNDVNTIGINVAQFTAQFNNISKKCRFSTLNVFNFFSIHSDKGNKFDIIDIDPFGCPTPYIDCAIRAIVNHGLISITATDTAVLCGIYPRVSYRKYYGFSLRTSYCHEISIRLLFGALAFISMRLNKGIQPIFAHTTRHYVRIYAYILSGLGSANQIIDNIGYILHCFKCDYRVKSKIHIENCYSCGAKYSIAGPLWIGNIFNKSFIECIESINNPLIENYRILFRTAKKEIDMPITYFDTDKISSKLKVKSPNLGELIYALENVGFKSTRTSINPKGIRTTAPIEFLKKKLIEITT
jgi:tRNA (guanine26-N2/guanine27-N2)-dimethyltransferase